MPIGNRVLAAYEAVTAHFTSPPEILVPTFLIPGLSDLDKKTRNTAIIAEMFIEQREHLDDVLLLTNGSVLHRSRRPGGRVVAEGYKSRARLEFEARVLESDPEPVPVPELESDDGASISSSSSSASSEISIPSVSSDRRSILIAKVLPPSSVEPAITSVELEAVKTRSIMQAQAALAFAPEAIEIALAESRIDTLDATERTMLLLKEVRYYGLRRTLERAPEGSVPS